MQQKSDSKTFLGKTVTVKMDRPLGSTHPDHGFTYTVNYGFIPGTVSGDGEEVDAYVLNVNTPLKMFTGTCAAIIRRKDEDDDKLVVVPTGTTITNAEIERQTAFRESLFKHEIIR